MLSNLVSESGALCWTLKSSTSDNVKVGTFIACWALSREKYAPFTSYKTIVKFHILNGMPGNPANN